MYKINNKNINTASIFVSNHYWRIASFSITSSVPTQIRYQFVRLLKIKNI